MKKLICVMLACLMLVCAFAACAPEEDKPKLSLAEVLAFADNARDIPIKSFSGYEYLPIGSSEQPIYYFRLKESEYAFSFALGSDGQIEYMMLSHSSGNEIYLFHKNPGILDPDAAQYTEDAKSYDIEKFIKEMSEE